MGLSDDQRDEACKALRGAEEALEYLVEHFSSVETPPVTSILRADGSLVEVLGRQSGPSLDLPQVSRE